MSHHFKAKKRDYVSGDWNCSVPGTAVSTIGGVVFSALLPSLENSHLLTGNPDSCVVNQVSTDSRKVTDGSLFVAMCGSQYDGHDFIDQAVEQNCSVLLVEKGRVNRERFTDSTICIVEVDSTRSAYAKIAEKLFGNPGSQMTMVGITGTNGKTTVSYLLESVLQQAGRQPGVIGTVNYRYQTQQGDVTRIPSAFTTPEPLLLQQTLRRMADAGVDTVVMEISSHGLEQQRIGELVFDVAAFTNLSRDHLDYHTDMESYFAAKSLLFTTHLHKGGKAVITMDDTEGQVGLWDEKLYELCVGNDFDVFRCGSVKGEIFPLAVKGNLEGSRICLQTEDSELEFTSPLVGDFNVANIQTTFAMALALGLDPLIIGSALSNAEGAPGRLQRMKVCSQEQGFLPTVFVDYAHTPDALEQVLRTVKALPHRALFCVFGCGGDRDAGKRPLMGEIAGKYCDVAIVSDDNPRSENSSLILAAVAAGVMKTTLVGRERSWLAGRKEEEQGFVQIQERAQGIQAAISAAGKDDIVLIAGKGHEQYQLTASGKHFFDDSLVASEALSRWRLESLVQAAGGDLSGAAAGEEILGNISTDSRNIRANDIFLALKGERFDGHAYVEQVVHAGAGCLILEQAPKENTTVPVVLVKDTQQALGDLAAYRRRCMKEICQPTVAAITGSCGKTTVKEMCAAIFAEQWPDEVDAARGRVLKTEGNFNNLIGLPLSLLPVTPRHKAVILEMGMNIPGEIARLTEIGDPDIACIVNIHGAHLQGLGDIDGVAQAKGELFRGCRKETVLVVNSDDSRVLALAQSCAQKKVFYGLNPDKYSFSLDVWGSAEEASDQEESSFTLHIRGDEARVVLQVPGSHNIANGIAAAAIAYTAGIGLNKIAEGLSSFVPTDRRMQLLDGPAGSRIINDTYNANPASMRAGINTLCQLGTGMHIAILGDMLEMGGESDLLHRELGAFAAGSEIQYLGLVGDFAALVAAGAEDAGMEPGCIRVFADKKECVSWIIELLALENVTSGNYILVKGSRGLQLETVVAQLVEKKNVA